MKQYAPFILLFLVWLIYYGVHSLLASDKVKEKLFEHSDFVEKNYRLAYSIISSLGLIPVLYLMIIAPKVEVLNGLGFFRPASYFIATLGIIFIRRAFKEYNLINFVGFGAASQDEQLNTSGILSNVRHPLYTGTILVFIALFFFSLSLSALIALIATGIYLPVGIMLEEKKLIKKYGQQYLDYKKQVPCLIPKKWI